MHLSQAPSITIDPSKERPWWADLAEKGLTIYQAEQVARVNRERLARGLPPLTDKEMRATAPAANVQVQLPPAVQNAAIIGAVALGLFVLTRIAR